MVPKGKATPIVLKKPVKSANATPAKVKSGKITPVSVSILSSKVGEKR